jgi:hypothetical protein
VKEKNVERKEVGGVRKADPGQRNGQRKGPFMSPRSSQAPSTRKPTFGLWPQSAPMAIKMDNPKDWSSSTGIRYVMPAPFPPFSVPQHT